MRSRFSIGMLICITAAASGIAVGVFFIYTLILRSNYKKDALAINDAFRFHTTATLSRGDLSFPVQSADIEYYDMFLLNQDTVVFSRKAATETDATIRIDFGTERLSFTGIDDGSAIALCWKTPENEKHYMVRSQMTFSQLNAFFINCSRKAE